MKTLFLLVCAGFILEGPGAVIPWAHAVTQTAPTTWSPYGPRIGSLSLDIYPTSSGTLTAFNSGTEDIIDNIAPASFGSNPDYFLTNPVTEYGISQIDLNHQSSFLGIALNVARTLAIPSATTTSTAAGCALGFGSITVNLVNLEEPASAESLTGSGPDANAFGSGFAAIVDPNNHLTAANQPSGSPSASVTSPTGTYVLPCMIAGNYQLSTSFYQGTATVTTTSGTVTTVTFKVNYNSQSSRDPTFPSFEIGRALAHLITKPDLATGLGTCDDIQVPQADGLMTTIPGAGSCGSASAPSAAILATDCTEDIGIDPTFTRCSGSPAPPISMYHLTSPGANTNGATLSWGHAIATSGYPSSDDLRAACDHFELAGFSVVGGTNCGSVLASYPNPSPAHLVPISGTLTAYITTDPASQTAGQILVDSLNYLFGTPTGTGAPCPPTCTVLYGTSSGTTTTTPTYVNPTTAQSIVSASANTGLWNFYTGSFELGSTPDSLFNNYNSQFAGAACSVRASDTPRDYPYYCNPAFDTQTSGGLVTPGNAPFQQAATIAALTGMTVPLYSGINQYAALNGWNYQPSTGSSLVNVQGHGFNAGSGYWSIMNMRPVPGYNPCAPPGAPVNCASYAPGGGPPDLIRRGLSTPSVDLSPFFAQNPTELEILSLVYDSMLQANPMDPSTTPQLVDWMTTRHTSSFNPTEVSCVGPPVNTVSTCVTGTVTQTWHLRNDPAFQDGTKLSALDIAYTILAYRDVPSRAFYPRVAMVSSAIGTDCGVGQACRTVQVKLQNPGPTPSPYYEYNMGTLPIIPRLLSGGKGWEPVCGTMPLPAGGGVCASAAYDPMTTANSNFIGSGPWLCMSTLPPMLGGPCTASGTSAVQMGSGSVLLKRYTGFTHCCPNLQGTSFETMSWGDKNNDGQINILDLGDLAFHFTTYDPYWWNPLYSTTPDFARTGSGAHHVIGQPDYVTSTPTLSQTGLDNPAGVAFDPAGNLWVADSLNNRILEFIPIGGSFNNGMMASRVLGQPNFGSNPAATSQSGLSSPQALTFDNSGDLWVADTGNNRVLEYVPSGGVFTNGMNAAAAIGQATFNLAVPGLSNTGLTHPTAVAFDPTGRLWVSDQQNNRVLAFPPPFPTFGSIAGTVIGQASFTTNTAGTTASQIHSPQDVRFDTAGNLWLADGLNARVLEFMSPQTTGMGATTVLGQNSFTTSTIGVSQTGLANPIGLAFDTTGDLWVADGSNNRIVDFAPPFSTGMTESIVLGQNGFGTNAPATTQTGLNSPSGLAIGPDGQLWAGDLANNRVLQYPFGSINVILLATVAIYWEHSITTPYMTTTLLGLDPDFDPFINNGNYYLGTFQINTTTFDVVTVGTGGTVTMTGPTGGTPNTFTCTSIFSNGRTTFICNASTAITPGHYLVSWTIGTTTRTIST